MKKLLITLMAAAMLAPAVSIQNNAVLAETEIATSSVDVFKNIKSEEVKKVMANTVMIQPGAEYGIVYGKKEKVSDDDNNVVYVDEKNIYAPTSFMEKAFPQQNVGSDAYVNVQDFVSHNGMEMKQIGETIYIYKNFTMPSKLPSITDRLFGVYVANDGNGSGSINSPVSDIIKARGIVMQLERQVGLLYGGIEIYLRGGIYTVKDTIQFTKEMSGLEDSPVIYKAYNGEKVSFNGGISIKGSEFKDVDDPTVAKMLPDASKLVYADVTQKLTGFNMSFKAADPASWNVNYQDNNLTVCRWPNKSFALTNEVLEEDKANWRTKGFRFVVDDTRMRNWANEDDPRIFGYFAVRWAGEFRKIIDVRMSDLSIASDRGAEYGILAGKEYYVYNMLCELDSGGEFFFDKKTNRIYLYPVEGDKNDKDFLNNYVQFALLSNNMITMQGCENIVFDGITFENTLYRVIDMDDNCRNITIKGCTFKNVSDGILERGFNNTITGCDFYSITANPITLRGGDRQTLTPSNSVVRNCFFKDFNTIQRTNCGAIRFEGVGEIVSHNEIVGGPHTAIGMSGNDNICEYNEFYDNLQDEAEDAGVIYGGRNICDQNTVIRNNYFHDIPSSMGVIYYDDTLSNHHAYSNVFINTGSTMIIHGGVRNTMRDSLAINGKSIGARVVPDGNAARFWNSSTNTSFSANTFLWRLNDYPYKSEPWQKYKDIFAYIDAHNDMEIVPPFDCEFTGNTFVNLADTSKTTEGIEAIGANVAPYVTIKDNKVISKEEAKDFVIPEKFQEIIDNSGIYIDEDRKTLNRLGHFNLISPSNRAENIEGSEVVFEWTKADNATKYLFTLSTDAEFKNIISNKYVETNSVTINRLNYNKTRYFWKVTAIPNDTNSMLDKAPVSSNQEYFSFTTKDKELINKEKMNDMIQLCKNRAETVVEGDNPGDYKHGVREEMNELIETYENRTNSAGITQRDLTKMVGELSSQFDILAAKKIPEYVNMYKLVSGGYWSITPNQYTIEPGKLTHSSKSNSTFGTAERIPTHQIMKFKAKADNIGSGFIGYGIRAQASPTAVAWNGNSQYIVIIKEKTIEFQKFGSGNSVFIEYPNDCIFSGQTHEIEYSALNNDNGSVDVTFKVDGKTIVEYNDHDEPIMPAGFFEVYATERDCTIELTADPE
ncbi:MAG: right-handed parallel beta-helix repeat-containing protein [Clostridia bacterium]|nr:right-handed parallel beta-helix repeat-containing protein [Clostridia bacterium]